jgi:predicted cupin superfamily sugar epimerase
MERDPQALALIELLGMIPHPEGGWYVEMAREGVDGSGGRGTLSTIYFLLEQGQRSHWHRIDAVEVWLWHAGSALALGVAAEAAGPVEWVRLGADILNGEVLQKIIPNRFWQAAEAREGWVLVSCVVAPGFEFAGFELAPAGWAPQQ